MPIFSAFKAILNAQEEDSLASASLLKKKSSGSMAAKNEHRKPESLLEIGEIDQMFVWAANASIVTWVTLLAVVYGSAPRSEWEYLNDGERYAASMAFFMLLIASFLILSPFCVQKRPMSAIVYAAIVTQVISMLTNGILAFLPTVVKVDEVTQARVFLVRWCEWVPLAGLMTFFSEAVGAPKSAKGVRWAILASLSQSLSCLCGSVLPFCPGLRSWLVTLFVACVTYLVIFLRLLATRADFLATPRGVSFVQLERYDRMRFSYILTAVCTVVWTVLVVLYFLNMAIHLALPPGHALRHESLAMGIDTFYDVLAKGLYMKLIVDVHFVVFDAEGRAQRQLSELRNLMSVLWDTSSDVIIISVRSEDKVTSMISPSFANLIGEQLPEDCEARRAMALLLEIERQVTDENPQGERLSQVTNAFYIDSSTIPGGTTLRDSMLAEVANDSPKAIRASGMVEASWNRIAKAEDKSSLLMMYPFDTVQGEECQAEIKVSRHASNALIAVVRDVTERYRRFEAERRAHAEALARQKDAQSQTRFVRHEVKNGLLAGIELCDSLRNAIEELEKSVAIMKAQLAPGHFQHSASCGFDDSSSSSLELEVVNTHNSRRYIEELDVMLHEVLDTALAEAMARDVVHEIYHPRLERIDVPSLLASSGTKSGKSERFPIEQKTPDMPYLQLDPQLLRFIHRNAVSNACKYGKQGGKVLTVISFEPDSRTFVMEVVNEPGNGHEEILAMGETAASEAVFAQGSRLHLNCEQSEDRYISSGDGAWIMQKCAKTMSGSCKIQFEKDRTVFTFKCPAEPLTVVEWPETKDFQVPSDTWGIAIDDSKIQRKLMARILAHAGIEEERRILLGKTPNEVHGLKRILLERLEMDSESIVFVLIDENLDFGSSGEAQVLLSGSLVMQDILRSLRADQLCRVFALVRSANDSSDDVAQYMERAHGFFPKAPMQRERVREILAPLWAERFLTQTPEPNLRPIVNVHDARDGCSSVA